MVKRPARQLITTSDPPAERPAIPAIVRVQPLADQDEETIRNVQQTWEETGAHVRVLPREQQPVEAVGPVDRPEFTSIREAVATVALEIKSADPMALMTSLGQIMTESGL